jgi:hypothetical protein
VQKRWFAEPEEDDSPLSPCGHYFILKTQAGKQGAPRPNWDDLLFKTNESVQGTIKSAVQKSLNRALSIRTSSGAGGSISRRTSNWGTGGIPSNPGYSHGQPAAGDALYSSKGRWGLSNGGREHNNELYQSNDGCTGLEEDPNANTWPPASSRVNRALSVLPEGAEEDERGISVMDRSSQMMPFRGSFLTSRSSQTPRSSGAVPAGLTVAADSSGMRSRRSSDPFPVQYTRQNSTGTPSRATRESCVGSESRALGQGSMTSLDCSATAPSAPGAASRIQGSGGQSTSGQGAAPALARICELGRMASSEMTVLVDRSMVDSDTEGSLRYTGAIHVNQHSPVNQAASEAAWTDGRGSKSTSSSGVSQQYRQGSTTATGTEFSRPGANTEAYEDSTSREGSWHSMQSTKTGRSRRDSASDANPSGCIPAMYAEDTAHSDMGLKVQVMYQRAGKPAGTESQKPSTSPQDPRQPMHAKRLLQIAQNSADSPRVDGNFDRLFSGPAPVGPLELHGASSRQLEAVGSFGASSVVACNAQMHQNHAYDSFPNPEPSVEPYRISPKPSHDSRRSRTPYRDFSRTASATAGPMHVSQNAGVSRRSTAPVAGAAWVHDSRHQRSQRHSASRSRSSQREQTRKESLGLDSTLHPSEYACVTS